MATNKQREIAGRHRKYGELMTELKLRLLFLEGQGGALLDGQAFHLVNDEVMRFEGLALQMRKVLELLAFSSLLVNKEAAAKARPDVATMWRAKKILQTLETINSDFFPIAYEKETPEPTRHNLTAIHTGVFTKAEFSALYDAMAKVMHVLNPLAEPKPITMPMSFRDAIARIRALLYRHYVSLASGDKVLVEMVDWNLPTVHVAHAIPKR